jgi:hypothetical protein
MFERLKVALVESFVGAIALGWVFAQGILHFAYIFSAPAAGWVMRREYHGIIDRAAFANSFSLQDAVPELIRSVLLLLVGYWLLRWLYFKPLKKQTTEHGAEPRSDVMNEERRISASIQRVSNSSNNLGE